MLTSTTFEWTSGPEWGIALTVLAYVGALLLRKKYSWLHPLFTSSVAVIVILLLTGISYEEYRIGGDYVIYMLGPATVALGVPLYKYGRQIRRYFYAILIGVIAGSAISLVATLLLASVWGLSSEIAASLLPKSVTTAISTQLAVRLGGIPELTAIFTVLTGLIGSMCGPFLLRLVGIRNDLSMGTAVGTASHGIGTARLVADSTWQGSISALAMSLSCIVTPLLMLPFYWWIPV